MKACRASLIIVSAVVLAGCAFGRHVNYSGSSDFSTQATKGIVVLGAQDQRPYVVSGDKKTSFVGSMRSLYGIPYDESTSSGEPLADEIGSLVAGALRKNGESLTQITIPVGTSPEQRIALVKATNSSRYDLIEIREWKTDTYFGVTLTYDISLSVVDGRGSTLASKSVKGTDELGSRPDRADLATAVSSIFGGLFNDPEIASASVSAPTLDPSDSARDPATAEVADRPADKVETNVRAEKKKYQSGELSRVQYEDTVVKLKAVYRARVQAAKDQYNRGAISKDEYKQMVLNAKYLYAG